MSPMVDSKRLVNTLSLSPEMMTMDVNIISQHTQDFDPKIRISNVINLLPKSKQELILKMILDNKRE
jgi:hypothetical protein